MAFKDEAVSPPAGRRPSQDGGTAAAEAAAPTRWQPSARVLKLWRSAQAVCFDVDCTVAVNDQLDLLADFMGVGEVVEQVTNAAMDGSMSLEEALEQRLRLINCTPSDIQAFLAAHPAESRLTPGSKELIAALQARGVEVYLISGGFRELCLPIARALGVPPDRVFANRMQWQMGDDISLPTKLVGFDTREPTGHQRGKVKAIAKLREIYPYEVVVMVGDGITDLEAVQETGGADLFIGYGGIAQRPVVMAGADWFVDSFAPLYDALLRYRVAMIGSGAWACAAVRLVAENTRRAASQGGKFVEEVKMWVYEEEVGGRKLTELINETHENIKYLPGHSLGPNVVACPDLAETVRGANALVFCCPHEFMGRVVRQLAASGAVDKDAIAISLTKGMRVRRDGPQLISTFIRKELGIDCSVLMGANIAEDIARGQLSEATIGYGIRGNALVWQELFETESFLTQLVKDVPGCEMAGTLKNVVALAAGFVDGLGLGPNTKAAIMRAGLNEMRRFSKATNPMVRDETFFESCGVADLIATCFGGRNRMVAKAYAEACQAGKPRGFDELAEELLKGQKLQGVLTSNEVAEILRARGWEAEYPLFTTVHRIVSGQLAVADIVRYRSAALVPDQQAQDTFEMARQPTLAFENNA